MSCEIEGFVDTCVCKLFVINRKRVLRVSRNLMKDTYTRYPLLGTVPQERNLGNTTYPLSREWHNSYDLLARHTRDNRANAYLQET